MFWCSLSFIFAFPFLQIKEISVFFNESISICAINKIRHIFFVETEMFVAQRRLLLYFHVLSVKESCPDLVFFHGLTLEGSFYLMNCTIGSQWCRSSKGKVWLFHIHNSCQIDFFVLMVCKIPHFVIEKNPFRNPLQPDEWLKINLWNLWLQTGFQFYFWIMKWSFTWDGMGPTFPSLLLTRLGLGCE